MKNEVLAEKLVAMAETLLDGDSKTAKKEVPEAFKKQWKNKDKDGDGKKNEPKPDFLKKKEEEKKDKKAASTFKCPSCGTKVLEQTGFCVKCKKKVKKSSVSSRRVASDTKIAREIVSIIRDLTLSDEG